MIIQDSWHELLFCDNILKIMSLGRMRVMIRRSKTLFFVGFDTWLGAKVAVWGNNFDSEDWRNYLTQTLAAESNANNATIATPPNVQNFPMGQFLSDHIHSLSSPHWLIAPLPTRRIPSSLQHSIPVPTQSRFPSPTPSYPPFSPLLASSSGHHHSVSALTEGTGGVVLFGFEPSSPIIQSHPGSSSSTPHRHNSRSRIPSCNSALGLLGMRVPPSGPVSNFETVGRINTFRPWE
ncbi:hypothetical protein GGU11DRAFT_789998 [Lentinula aff. detonsa]|nr:hypothetical protein GGU11DRAFT_789998 [Lentinula aff. detonsa]